MQSLRFPRACSVLAPLLMLAAVLAGCGGGSPATSQNPGTPSITVTGSGQVRLGSTDSFTATVTNLSNTQCFLAGERRCGRQQHRGNDQQYGRLHAPGENPCEQCCHRFGRKHRFAQHLGLCAGHAF